MPLHWIRIVSLWVLSIASSSAALANYTKLSEGITISRDIGKPKVETISFHEQTGSHRKLVVKILDDKHDRNNSERGYDLHGHDRCYATTGVITLNGQEVFNAKHFRLKTDSLSKVVTMKTDNVLTVQLRGKPGCAISVSLARTNV